MDFEILLPSECVAQVSNIASRKRALAAIADLLAQRHPEVSARLLLDALAKREQLGSTSIGEGVAIPHCRLDCRRMMAAFLRLEQGIDYDAIDGQPVDLLFALVVPRQETRLHLQALTLLAAAFGDRMLRHRLRQAPSTQALAERLREALRSQARQPRP